MIQQEFTFDFNTEPIITIIMLIFLLALMLLIYAKFRIFVLALVVEIFSLIIGLEALSISGFPLSPYFQLFFILIQSVLFTIISLEAFGK